MTTTIQSAATEPRAGALLPVRLEHAAGMGFQPAIRPRASRKRSTSVASL